MIKLSDLHEQRVDVEILIHGKSTSLSGVGHYATDPMLGTVLRIRFPQEAGGMEILLEEAAWTGQIERPADDKPYSIRLDAASTSSPSGA